MTGTVISASLYIFPQCWKHHSLAPLQNLADLLVTRVTLTAVGSGYKQSIPAGHGHVSSTRRVQPTAPALLSLSESESDTLLYLWVVQK